MDSHEELYSGRPYGALDSGFNSVDSGDKRWSGNEVSVLFMWFPDSEKEIKLTGLSTLDFSLLGKTETCQGAKTLHSPTT